MNDKDNLYVALLVIELGGTFSNSYGLCRLLARRFEIFDCIGVIYSLIAHSYVDYENIKGGKQFFINDQGKEVLDNNRDQVIEMLKQKFPNELSLINQL